MRDELKTQSDSKQTAKKEEAANPNQSAIESATEKIISALTRINRANRKADTAENERNHIREQRRFVIEKIEIALITVYAIATIAEWSVFHAESKTMQTELQTVQSNSVTEQKFNERQLSALQGQLDEMKRTRDLDERAWIYVGIQDNNLTRIPNFLVFHAFAKNTGKTPAIITGSWETFALNTNEIGKIDPKVGGVSTLVPPNSSMSMPSPQIPINATFYGVPIYIFGTIYYRDIFQENHWIQFCYAVTEQGNTVTPALFHNSCDDAQTSQTN